MSVSDHPLAPCASVPTLVSPLSWVLVVLGLALACGTLVRLAGLLRARKQHVITSSRQFGSLITWWVLFGILALVVFLGVGAAVVIFALVSWLGLREFLLLTKACEERGGKNGGLSVSRWWVYLAVPIQYGIVYAATGNRNWLGPFWTFIPVWVLCLLLVRLVVLDETTNFAEKASMTFLGLMLSVFLLSHTVLILSLPDDVNPAAGSMGLFLYLIVLTEVNDIAQALWGRRLGQHKITPTVSPNKTWEGLLLGGATTVVLALVLAPHLTPFTHRPLHFGNLVRFPGWISTCAVGVLIVLGGFFGDITLSAIKREAGVKDSGTLLPGQGGILDRIDSLTFTAPLFFYFTYIFYCGNLVSH